MIDKHFILILNDILDFDDSIKTESEFIEMMKDTVSNFIGELIEEL